MQYTRLPVKAPRSSRSGSAIVEFALVVLPLMGLLLISIDAAWCIFARATLQHAVREGVRFAITGQILPGNTCLGSSVQQIVRQNSFGLISPSQAASIISINYLAVDPATGSLIGVSGAGAAAGGNVIEVVVSGLSVRSFGPLFRDSNPLLLGAKASDVMESSPNGIPPCP